ncbi:tubulin-specific chaperone E [Periophthalmus magnuspinnatus]|uniref:tubulin-specific chaperone E n=1 Tax=Periophthalmus magnuspinnatus TaxID=409849 RepID=UPI00145A2C3D|nr:tubulin-specific chaperone E [Periophthalmus magnuspinnatus]
MAVDPEPLLPEDAVGRRVSCGGDRATVRYVGPVPPTKGVWLGVEWDNPERGKHDGVHEGVQYFTCSCPGSGSFVRPSKVSFGVDFLSVVHELYEKDQEQNLNKDVHFILDDSFSLENRRTMTLDQKDVNGPGEDGAIRKTTPNVQWLNLSRSLIGRWDDVAAITVQLEALQGLELRLNRLQMPSDPPRLSKAFLHLTVLNLSECALSWTQVLQCAPMWPQLEDLGLEGNCISTLSNPGSDLFQTLKSLSLSQNPLDQLSILSLSSLPRLEQLNLSKTQLSSIQFSDAGPGEETKMFPVLKNLNLDHNNISEWRVVNELSKLRSLVQFSCKRNHLKAPDGNHRTTSQLLIAKLGRLLVVNSCEIKQEERRGAELDYIKMFGEAWLKAGGRVQLSPDFITDHPRYQDLIQKYGAPEEGEMKKPQPFALKNQLLKISFEFPDDSERKRLEKKLPASMEVQKVKGLLHRLLKVPATELHLSYTSPKMVGTEFQLDNDLKSLQFYSIEAGDTVQVRWS